MGLSGGLATNGTTGSGGPAGLPSTDDLSAIANANATAAAVPMNGQKFTGLANGSAATDSAAFGQVAANPMPNLVAPFHPGLLSNLAASTINRLELVRVTVPKTGVLHDLTYWTGVTSGNVIGSVYDTGDATAGSITNLYSSGSVAASTTNSWQVIGSPGINVTQGQQLYLGIQADNTTLTIGRVPLLSANQSELPASFWPAAGGIAPFLSCYDAAGSFAAPGAVTQASLTLSTSLYFLMARIV